MADLIQVSWMAMDQKADTLKSAADAIKQLTDDISTEISRLKPAWEGDAAEKFVMKFDGLKDDFKTIFDDINKYSLFLKTAAKELSDAEGARASEEDSLENSVVV